jgi:hypothetical protein
MFFEFGCGGVDIILRVMEGDEKGMSFKIILIGDSGRESSRQGRERPL